MPLRNKIFSCSLRASLVTLAASVMVVVSATPTLFVKTSSIDPPRLKGEILKVTATITNTGNDTLTLLNDPNSPLNKLPTDTFNIVSNVTRASPDFIGIKVTYVPAIAIADGKRGVTILVPGESVQVEHDLSNAYDFSTSGQGAYSIKANDLFYMVDSRQQAVPLYATVKAHTITLAEKPVIRSRLVRRATQPTYIDCSPKELEQLRKAAAYARRYANNAITYLAYHNSATDSGYYTTWFGTYDRDHHRGVIDLYRKLSTYYNYDCSCPRQYIGLIVYGSVEEAKEAEEAEEAEEPHTIHICPPFWSLGETGTISSQAAILLRVASHFYGITGTRAYPEADAQILIREYPHKVFTNADNYLYFALNLARHKGIRETML